MEIASSPEIMKKALAARLEELKKAKVLDKDYEYGLSNIIKFRCPICMDIIYDAIKLTCNHRF